VQSLPYHSWEENQRLRGQISLLSEEIEKLNNIIENICEEEQISKSVVREASRAKSGDSRVDTAKRLRPQGSEEELKRRCAELEGLVAALTAEKEALREQLAQASQL
jgi:hypothetical protein